MYFIITAMLFFSSIDQVIYTQYDKATFNSVKVCQEFLFQNKVKLLRELFMVHNKSNNKIRKYNHSPLKLLETQV